MVYKLFSLVRAIRKYEAHYYITIVKPVYNSLGYNEAYRLHRSHRFLNGMIGYNENSLFTNNFGRTDLFVINGFNCSTLLVCLNFELKDQKWAVKASLKTSPLHNRESF
jgi:hypothetical protein